MVDFANCRIPTVERTGMRSQNGLYLPFRGLLGASVDRRRRRLFTMASNPRQPTRSMRRDVVVLGGVLLIAMGSAHAFSLWEEVLGWSQAGDRWDVEELALVSAITLIGFAVFAARRWSELMMTVNALAISERKSAELRDIESRFTAAFDHASMGMALLSESGHFLSTNRTLCDMIAMSEENLRDSHLIEIIDPDDQPAVARALRSVAHRGGDAVRFEGRLLSQHGSHRWARLNMAPVRDSDGSLTSLVAHIEDVTHQVEVEQRLRELIDSKDQLIASVSHELRTPLTSILGYSQLLLDSDGGSPDGERGDMLRTLARQATDLSNIIEDLLVASRAEFDTVTVDRVPVDLGAQAKQVVEALHPSEMNRVRIVGDASTAVGDSARVRQIIRNLVSNALRYGGEDIEISFRSDDHTVVCAVADNGDGIDPSDQDRIFEPYHRVHQKRGVTASIGLGLTVSRHLAEALDGGLTYRYDDSHSIFELSLPPHHDSTPVQEPSLNAAPAQHS